MGLLDEILFYYYIRIIIVYHITRSHFQSECIVFHIFNKCSWFLSAIFKLWLKHITTMSQLDEIIYDVINNQGPFDELIDFINKTNLRETDLVMIDRVIDVLEMREKSLQSLKRKIHLIKNDKYLDIMLQKRAALDFNT